MTDHIFQSTLPVWGATTAWELDTCCFHNFNPRSPCGERRCFLVLRLEILVISIHAPRVGSDWRFPAPVLKTGEFQSTLPVWGATVPLESRGLNNSAISIHAPRVGSDGNAIAAYVEMLG